MVIWIVQLEPHFGLPVRRVGEYWEDYPKSPIACGQLICGEEPIQGPVYPNLTDLNSIIGNIRKRYTLSYIFIS